MRYLRPYQSLAAAEATGGLGSTATSNQLATIAPTLGQSWLSNQMSNYNNLANVGLGALQGQANAGQTYANNMSSIAQQSAALAAANANKPSSLQTAISGGTSGAITGAGLASLLGTSTPWGAGIGAGIGDGTYQPAPRVTTQGLEQDFGLQQGALTPQTTEGKVFAEALPYLTPAGIERAATQAPTLAGRIAQGATRLLAENAVGSLAANSAKDDAEALATDLGVGVLAGGAINAAGRGLGAAYRGVRGAIAPEAQQAIRFAEREGVPLHTTDLLQPTSRVGKMAQTTAENIPWLAQAE